MDSIRANPEMKREYLLIPKIIAEGDKGNHKAYADAFILIKEMEKEGSETVTIAYSSKPDKIVYNDQWFQLAHEHGRDLRVRVARAAEGTGNAKMYNLYRDLLLFDAPWDFDCFCRYIEPIPILAGNAVVIPSV